MAISQDSNAGPSAESLSLSASLFTSQISSWIPANFGQSSKPSASTATTAKTQQSSLDSVLQTEHDRGERLGLGHPLLDVPKHQRRQETSSSLSTLGKRMGLEAKGKGKAKDESEVELGVAGRKEESEDEEESRGRIGKKRKVDKVDMFAGKKKAKTKAKPESQRTTHATPLAAQSQSSPQTSTNDESIPIPNSSPVSDSVPTKSDLSTFPTTTTAAPTPAVGGLNKNQRKKLRKKQKKLAQGET